MCNLFEQIHIVARSMVDIISIRSHFYSGWGSTDDVLFLKIVIIIFIRVNILIALVAGTIVRCWFSFELMLTIFLDSECDWVDALIVNDLLSKVLLFLTTRNVLILSWVWLSSICRFKSFPSVPFTVLLSVHSLIRHIALHRDRVCCRFDDQGIFRSRGGSDCHVPLLVL